MDHAALLTDDEIVALCAIDGRPWPLGLITVEPTTEELTRAGVRGIRSLFIRHLADQTSDGVRPNEVLVQRVTTFLDATNRIGAYVAPADDHLRLGGAAITAAQTSDGWLLDATTAVGVHALRHVTADEAADAIAGMIERADSGELFTGAVDSNAWACVVQFGTEGIPVQAEAASVRDAFRQG